MRNYLTWFIVLATCSVALGPLCLQLVGPAAYARWMLAKAANEYQDNHPEEAEKTLAKAFKASSSITGDPEFWKLRFQMVFHKKNPDPDVLSKLSEEAKSWFPKMDPPRRAQFAKLFADLFQENGQLHLALDVLQTGYPPIKERSSKENNELAYFRSLLDEDLEIALQEINLAMAESPNEPAFMDTKAWVLHRLNRNDAAIKFADASVKGYYESFKEVSDNKKDSLEFYKMLEPDPENLKLERSTEDTTSNASATNATQIDAKEADPLGKEADPLGKIVKRFPLIQRERIEFLAHIIAVVRYHRACILDELGRMDDSKIDYDWLARFGFSDFNKLN